LQLNVHFYVLVPDGGFDDDGIFVADEAPNDDDVRRIMARAGRRVMSRLHSYFDDDDERRREIDRLLQSLDAASATPQPVLFPRDARRVPLSAFIEGFSLPALARETLDDRVVDCAVDIVALPIVALPGGIGGERHRRTRRRLTDVDVQRARRWDKRRDSAPGRVFLSAVFTARGRGRKMEAPSVTDGAPQRRREIRHGPHDAVSSSTRREPRGPKRRVDLCPAAC
jgi:hypothetical protein